MVVPGSQSVVVTRHNSHGAGPAGGSTGLRALLCVLHHNASVANDKHEFQCPQELCNSCRYGRPTHITRTLQCPGGKPRERQGCRRSRTLVQGAGRWRGARAAVRTLNRYQRRGVQGVTPGHETMGLSNCLLARAGCLLEGGGELQQITVAEARARRTAEAWDMLLLRGGHHQPALESTIEGDARRRDRVSARATSIRRRARRRVRAAYS